MTTQKKIKLIDALRSVAGKLERHEVVYRWTNARHCNCGLLAKELTGLQDFRLEHGVWSKEAGHCSQTGQSLPDIIVKLENTGIGQRELFHIENLSDQGIKAKAGLPLDTSRTYKYNVIKYFRAWADILEGELTTNTKASTVIYPDHIHVHMIKGDHTILSEDFQITDSLDLARLDTIVEERQGSPVSFNLKLKARNIKRVDLMRANKIHS